MSKKKDKKKENLLAETVGMQKKQAMNLVAQSTVNQQLLEEVIGIKEEMDRNVKKTNQKLTDIELLVEEVNKKSISTMVKQARLKAWSLVKLVFSQICTSMSRKHILAIICSL